MRKRKIAQSLPTLWNEARRKCMPTVSIVQSPELRSYVGIVTIAAFSLAIGYGWALSKDFVFEYHDASGVVGWIHVHQYPKQQEFFYYLLALLGTPALICGYWGGWLVYSYWAAKTSGMSIQWCLKAHALASLPLCLSWMALYPFPGQEWVLCVLPIGLSLLITFGILFWSRRKGAGCPGQSLTGYPQNVQKHPLDAIAPLDKCNPPPQKNWKKKESLFGKGRSLLSRVLAYFCLPVFIYLLTYRGKIHGGIDLFHEGEFLAPLNEMLRGGIPFRDIYIQHGLFQNAILPWLGSQFFEPTLWGVRLIQDALGPLGYVTLYLLGLQVFRYRMLTAFLCVLIASVPTTYVSPRHSLGLLAFACVANDLTHSHQRRQGHKALRSCASRFEWRLGLAGFFTSGAFWYSTEIGLYSLAGIGVFLLLYSRQRHISSRTHLILVINYTCGVLIGILPVSLYFLWNGALDDAIWNTYIQCRYQIATWGLPFPSLSDTLATLHTEGWHAFLFDPNFQYYLPVCVFVSVSAYLTYRGLCRTLWQSEVATKLLLLWLGGVAFFRTALGRTDPGHLGYGSTFLWLICLLLIEQSLCRMTKTFFFTPAAPEKPRLSTDFSRPGVVLKSAWRLIPTVIFFWYIGTVYQPFTALGEKWQRLRQNPFPQRIASEEIERAGRIDITDQQVQFLQKVLAYIQEQTAPDEKIFDFSSQGAFYFFANRPSVTRYHQIVYAATPAMQREVLAALEADKTRIVLFKTGWWFDAVDDVPAEQRHPIIAAYLRENYELAPYINHRIQILQRKNRREK